MRRAKIQQPSNEQRTGNNSSGRSAFELSNMAPSSETITSDGKPQLDRNTALGGLTDHSMYLLILMVSQRHLADINTSSLSSGSLTASNHKAPPPMSDMQITLCGMSALAAILTNAYILNISCEPPRLYAIHIAPSTQTPPALTPTALQISKPHWPYLDMLPFPSLRDKLLKGNDIIDVVELWSDIVGGDIKVWGKTPWDSRGWEVQERFASKWWWLMTDEVLEETNFWRVSRGERPLGLAAISQKMF